MSLACARCSRQDDGLWIAGLRLLSDRFLYDSSELGSELQGSRGRQCKWIADILVGIDRQQNGSNIGLKVNKKFD